MMHRKTLVSFTGILTVLTILFTYTPVLAVEDVEALKKQIAELQKRVDELEAQKPDNERDDYWGFFNRRQRPSWDPFEEIHRIQQEMDRMFQNSFTFMKDPKSGIFSSNMTFDYDLDLNETDTGYEIKLDMEGLDQKNFDIEINDNILTVKGEGSRKDIEESQNGVFRSQSYGSFVRTIPLPLDADTDKVETEKQEDTLIIKLPKRTT